MIVLLATDERFSKMNLLNENDVEVKYDLSL